MKYKPIGELELVHIFNQILKLNNLLKINNFICF